jgi:ferric-dicitrate binding protein FerR (iron transport regulator)
MSRLVPNEQSTFNKAGAQFTKCFVNPYQFVAWKNGRLVFQDENLEEIMKMMAKWYNIDVVFASEELKSYRFTGDLERYADFSEVLRKIGKTEEVHFLIDNKLITIR